MKKVPFVANHEDNMHCALAVYRMLFAYFMDRDISWHEMEKMSGFTPGKAAWTITIWERMSKQGFDIRMVEAFDYQAYQKEGAAYLKKHFSAEQYKWYLAHSNLAEIQPQIASFLKEVNVECRRPTLGDIDTMLADGRLIFVTLNSKVLKDSDGFQEHAVLIIDKKDGTYIVHDPGSPPQPYREIPAELLWRAMGAEKSTSEVTGVKFKPRMMRVDLILANMHPTYSRAALAKLFDKGLVSYKGKILKTGDKLLSDIQLEADLSSLHTTDATIDIPLLYEDDDVLVMNKPAGVLTHVQGAFNPEATIATFIRKRTAEMTGERAGIVHRLDRPTSGVIIGAKHAKVLGFLQKQFADRKVQKTYVAIVKGHLPQKEAIIDMPIERNPKAPATFRVGPNGKSATTRYKVIEESGTASLVELKPVTGRTHQLRVHLAQLGHPIIGDPLYGNGTHGDRLFLHARDLTITLPGEAEPTTFTAPLPPEFEEQMRS